MEISKCRKCDSTNLEYKINYEHLDVCNDSYINDDGWLCLDCETFHLPNGDYEYYPDHSWFDGSNVSKVNQLIK